MLFIGKAMGRSIMISNVCMDRIETLMLVSVCVCVEGCVWVVVWVWR